MLAKFTSQTRIFYPPHIYIASQDKLCLPMAWPCISSAPVY